MALQKSFEIYGTTYAGYIKIDAFFVREQGRNDEGVKIYSVTCDVKFYTDTTKEYLVKGETIVLDSLVEAELNISSLYTKLKALPEFEGAIDV